MKQVQFWALLALVHAVSANAQTCPGDFNADARVDGNDLGLFLASWGPCPTASCPADFNADAQVDGIDLGVLLASWGTCRPAIESISPSEGSVAGGTPITVQGRFFLGATSLRIGGVAATDLVVVSSTLLTAVTPPGIAGPSTVSVTANGTGVLPGAFDYRTATVAGVSPSPGPMSGGTEVTITGAYLQATTSVRFGSHPSPAFTQVSPTEVRAVTPASAVAGPVDVSVATAAGTAVLPGGFTYADVVVPPWATLVELLPSPAVVTDPDLRAAIAVTRRAWRVRHSATQIEMLLVPPGWFSMGCTQGSSQSAGCPAWELPVHPVQLTSPFYIGRHEVTQSQWQAIAGSNPSFFQGSGYANAPDRPVESISWAAAHQGLMSVGLRLPTEAEWERACRGGTVTAFNNGLNDDAFVTGLAWFLQNSVGQTSAVGLKQANRLGLLDTHGNVWEWTGDWWSEYSPSTQVDPTGPPKGVNRVVRGGGFSSTIDQVRSSSRALASPLGSSSAIGVRAACSP
jgi:formylglycine-generating enzyme required for sulfatase activity